MTVLAQKFSDLKAQLTAIGFSETRQNTAEFLEAVFLSSNLAGFTGVFEGLFGSAVYPSDKPIPEAVKKVIDRCGGVMGKQTLYASVDGNELVFAMLWPWSDGGHITLKSGRATI